MTDSGSGTDLLRCKHLELSNVTISEEKSLKPKFESTAYELIAKFKIEDVQSFGIKVRKREYQATVVGYEVDQDTLFVDRTDSGYAAFDPEFASREIGPLLAKDDK